MILIFVLYAIVGIFVYIDSNFSDEEALKYAIFWPVYLLKWFYRTSIEVIFKD